MTEQPEPSKGPVPKELSGTIGKYEILKPLGKGAMGMVYLAHDTILERDVALKVMVSQIADDPELNQRFIREAKAVAKMTHPNVVQVFDLGHHTDGSPYIAMELLKGMDLQKAMRTPPPMSLDRKVAIIVQVLAGLAHAHQAGIVHRDIKPANVFINHDGSVKIMDFGVARLTTASMTGTGNIVGTADYMSPEQVKGAKVDGRSDLFSVGCMLFELCAGKRPFHSDNLMAIFYKITHEEPTFDAIPEGADYDALMPILKKALAKDLADRYQNAYEFAVALREFLKDHATSVSGEHALEGLLDLEEPPPGVPEPITDGVGPTLVGADEGEVGGTVDLASIGTRAATRPGSSGRTSVPTRSGTAPTVIGPGARGTGVGKTVVTPAARPPLQPRPLPPPSGGHPALYGTVGALLVALAVAGGYIYLNHRKPGSDTPATTVASMPPVTAAPASTVPATTLPAPSLAPPPTMTEAHGKGSVNLKAGLAAFRSGDYGRAVSQFQSALGEDPSNADARRMLASAQKGLAAMQSMQTAEAALRNNDYAAAMTAARAASEQADWDPRITSLIQRINQAQQNAQQHADQEKQQAEAQQKAQQTKQVNTLLEQADQELGAQKYDAAIAIYDSVLKLDPTNQRALIAKTSAIGARAVAQSANNRGGSTAAKAFVSGKTVARGSEPKTGGVPAGFEDTPGVAVKKGTVAADLPGRILFDVTPDAPKPGEKYSVKVYMQNEGRAPIQVRDMIIKTSINGRGASSPVPTVTKDVAPQQKALLLDLSGNVWKEDTTSWTMDVTVHTMAGESYANQVAWK
jgi:tRNA A-37 threonylcarbamoyl transferase component Bud32/tetratricopeptide (TPR) repeat protein